MGLHVHWDVNSAMMSKVQLENQAYTASLFYFMYRGKMVRGTDTSQTDRCTVATVVTTKDSEDKQLFSTYKASSTVEFYYLYYIIKRQVNSLISVVNHISLIITVPPLYQFYFYTLDSFYFHIHSLTHLEY